MSTLLQPVIAFEELVLQGLHELGLARGPATQIPAGILVYLIVSAAFGVAQKLALRAPAPAA